MALHNVRKREMRIYVHRKTFAQMVTVRQIGKAQTSNHHCPSVNEWLNNLWHIYNLLSKEIKWTFETYNNLCELQRKYTK